MARPYEVERFCSIVDRYGVFALEALGIGIFVRSEDRPPSLDASLRAGTSLLSEATQEVSLEVVNTGDRDAVDPGVAALLVPRRLLDLLRLSPATDLWSCRLRFKNLDYAMTPDDLVMLSDPEDAVWPNLSHFQVRYCDRALEDIEYGRATRPLPTLASVRAFARAHPRMDELGVPALDVEDVRAAGDEDVRTLRYLHIGTLERGKPLARLAAALLRTFPELRVPQLRAPPSATVSGAPRGLYGMDVFMEEPPVDDLHRRMRGRQEQRLTRLRKCRSSSSIRTM